MKPTNILVVDDDPVTLAVVQNCFLGDPHVNVVTSLSGAQAWMQLRSGRQVDQLLVDWNMPVMTGYELVHQLRSDSRFNHVRILMLTCETSVQHIKLALDAGADEYLMKPFTKEMLLTKLALLDCAQ